MANRERGEVSLPLDGKEYTLRLSTDAICQAEERFSLPDRITPFEEIVAAASKGSVRHIRGIIWAALQEHHPEMTWKAVGDLIDKAGGVPGLANSLVALQSTMQPDPLDAEEIKGMAIRPTKARVNGRRGHGGSSTSRPDAVA